VKKFSHALNPKNWHVSIWAAICLLGVIMSSYAWIVSSPTAGSPDDDFHQGSIWCPTPINESCDVIYTDQGDPLVMVPQTVAMSSCYAHNNTVTGACTEELSDDVLVPSIRFDNGLYPGFYYDVMHLFVEHDVDRTILVIRWINVGLAALIYGALFFLAPPSGKRLVAYTLLGTSVPLVTFFSTSINPSAWGILGVVSVWLALHFGISSTSKPRRIAFFCISLIGAAMAAGARADCGSYLAIVSCAIVIYHWPEIRHRLRLLIPIVVVVVLGVLGFLSGSQNAAASSGLWNNPEPSNDPIRILAYNLFNMPNFFTDFWNFSLGWLDTPIPMATIVLAAAVTLGLCAWGIGRDKLSFRHVLSLAGMAMAILCMPLLILQANLGYYPNGIQARYIAPLIVVFVGMCLADRQKNSPSLPFSATVIFYAFIVIANMYALYTLIHRYVSGLTASKALNLSLGIQWWRAGGPTPMYTWLMGTVGFALMATILFAVRLHSPSTDTIETQVDDSLVSISASSAGEKQTL